MADKKKKGSKEQPAVVVHLPRERKFAINFSDGGTCCYHLQAMNGGPTHICRKEQAVLEYSEDKDGVLDYYHTFTPPSKRGQGIAAKLATAAFDYAKENDRKMRPSCWYLRDNFLPEHPEYKDNVV
ncbi:N-acetyltransferase domain-containing protein [Balamuthia mandrillaris]